MARWYLSYSLSYRDIEEMMLERGIKRVTKPMIGFKAFHSAEATLSGIELHHMLRKGQHNQSANQTIFEQFYGLAA